MPKQINTPNPGQALVRMFSLKGRFQPVLDEVIVPVVQVPVDAPEVKKLAVRSTTAAVSGAGNVNRVQVVNPAGSGTLIVLTSWRASSDATLGTDFIAALLTRTAQSGGSGGTWRDSRLDFNPASRARFVSSVPAFAALTNTLYPVDGLQNLGTWTLEPSSFIDFRQFAQNQTLNMTFEWYEVAMAGGERF